MTNEFVRLGLKLFSKVFVVPPRWRLDLAKTLAVTLKVLPPHVLEESTRIQKLAESIFLHELLDDAYSEINCSIDACAASLDPLELTEEFGVPTIEKLQDHFYSIFRKMVKEVPFSQKWLFKHSFGSYIFVYIGARRYIRLNVNVDRRVKDIILDCGDKWVRNVEMIFQFWWSERLKYDVRGLHPGMLPGKGEINNFLHQYIRHLEESNKLVLRAESSSAADSKTISFERKGDYWKVTYLGDTKSYRDTKGIKYIAYLLDNANQDFSPLQIEHYFSRAKPDGHSKFFKDMDSQQLDEEHDLAKTSFKGVKIMDEKYIKQAKDRLDEIEEDINEIEEFNDESRLEELDRLKNEKSKILRYLAIGMNLRGKSRIMGGVDERARVRVTRNIKNEIKKIAGEQKKLGAYLDRFVITGDIMRYNLPSDSPLPHSITL